jgi:hypothetical protein
MIRGWKLTLLIVLLCPWPLLGQEPFMHLDSDGYFQQTVDHVIDAQLLDVRHELHGNITTLDTLVAKCLRKWGVGLG